MKWASRNLGFTIVELLIVIVVIAILATITIVAYNGVTQRAQASAAQNALSLANRKVLEYAVDHADQYPLTLEAAGVVSDSVEYTYHLDRTSDTFRYCIEASTGNVSYYFDGDDASVAEGMCPITNIALNPNADGSSTTYFSSIGNSAAPRNRSIASDRSHSGATSLKLEATGSGQMAAISYIPTNTVIVRQGESFAWSIWVYSTRAGEMRPYAEGTRVADATYAAIAGSINMTVPAHTWTKIEWAGVAQHDMYVNRFGGYNLQVQAGDIVWVDEVIGVVGATEVPEYADGGSTGWTWDGQPHQSSSTGPPL